MTALFIGFSFGEILNCGRRRVVRVMQHVERLLVSYPSLFRDWMQARRRDVLKGIGPVLLGGACKWVRLLVVREFRLIPLDVAHVLREFVVPVVQGHHWHA